MSIDTNKDLYKEISANTKDLLLSKLYDIDYLDNINWWPLAPGFWVLIILFLLLFFYIIFRLYKKRAWLNSWQGKIYFELDKLQKTLNQDNARGYAILTSKLARRIIMHKYSRKDTASLVDNKWLQFLQKNDGKNFDWENNGIVFTKEIFSPKNTNISLDKFNNILNAMKKWVK